MDIHVERNVAIPMRDGTLLRADVFRPAPEGEYPVLLTRLPYGKSTANLAYGWLQPIRPASEGYVVVIQDVRGRWASEGEFRPFEQEVNDGFDSVEWCASQPWSNGRVGMYGYSYYGATQWLAAMSQAPNLQCIFPGLTASDFYDGWTYRGGAFELGFNLTWTAALLAPPEITRLGLSPEEARAALAAVGGTVMDPWPALRTLPVGSIAAFDSGVSPYFNEWLDRPDRDAFWDNVSIEGAHSRVRVPAFNLGGWYDLFIRGTLRNFAGMRSNGATPIARDGQKLLVGPWSHGSVLGANTGARCFGPAAQVLLEDLQMRWFDRWLKDIENGIDTEPPVRVFTMGANRWDTFSEWPPAESWPVRYYLHSAGGAATLNGDGTLSTSSPDDERADHFLYDPLNPCPTNGGALFPLPVDLPPGPFDQSGVEQRPDVLCYTTLPLEAEVQVTGTIEVTLWVASTATSTDFTAKLVDVLPDGTAYNLTDGVTRVRFQGPAGQPAQVTIDLAGTSNVFRPGHRVRLEVSSSNFPRFDRNTNRGDVIAADAGVEVATNTVFHDDAHPSHITLPVVTH